jgi:hypothetical protein
MKNIVVIGGGGHRHKIINVMRELSQEEMRDIGIVNVSEMRDIPCITTNDLNILNGRGYSKQMKKPNSKYII